MFLAILSPYIIPVICIYQSKPTATNFVTYLDFIAPLVHSQRQVDAIYFAFSNTFNLLKTKRTQLYLKTQFVPRSKHFSSRL